MKERLIIKNFGPIKSVDLELGKMNILIGESASGKSTVAKVLSICRYFSYIIEDDYIINEARKNLSFIVKGNEIVRTALEDWGLSELGKKDTYINYENDNYIFEIKGSSKNDKIDELPNMTYVQLILQPLLTPKSEEFKKLLKLTSNEGKSELDQNNWKIPNSFLFKEVKRIMKNPFYLPTERGLQSIFSLGKSSIQNISDSLFNNFSRLDGIARTFKTETHIEPLNISYYNANGHGYVKNESQDEFTSLANGASGYQSTIPIVLTIKYYTEKERRKKTFIIEEPELNLYPKAQKKLVEFLTFSINDFDHQMLLTTHSPYILTALENLMYAFKMGTIVDGKYKEQVKEIVEEKYWINPEDVNVYFLGKDGSIDLMQRDYALIDKDYIDSVSDDINEIFDKLLSLQVKHENAIEK